DRAIQGVADGLRLSFVRHYTTNNLALQDSGYRHSKGLFGHFFQAAKPALSHLLLAGFMIKLYNLDQLRIVKIRYGRVIKCNMPIFADPDAGHVYGMSLQQLFIPLDFFSDIGGVAVQEISLFGLHFVNNALMQIFAEAGLVIRTYADIFVEVKRCYP